MRAERVVTDPYHSRDVARWELVERRDPVVWGARPGPLSETEVARFRRDGFIVLERLLDADEVARLEAEARALAEISGDLSEGVVHEPGRDTVRSVFRAHRHSAWLRSLVFDDRLHRAAVQILGGDAYVHQSRLNFKPGFDGQAFQWHSDFETWHVEDGMPRMRAVSASVLLTDNHASNGPVMLVRGSHRWYLRCVGETPDKHYEQSLKAQRYGTPNPDALEALIERCRGIETITAPAGSVLLFDCNAMHGSGPNMTPYPRHNLFIVYNSVDNQLVEPFGGTPPRPEFLAERVPLTHDERASTGAVPGSEGGALG